jgi:hypothetical protein
MGDATRGRIADLESGWEVPPGAKGSGAVEVLPPPVPAAGTPNPAAGPPESEVSGELPRKKKKTQPPPPPGSPARAKAPSEPPPLPLPAPPVGAPEPPIPRAKPPTRPPPVPRPPPIPHAAVGDEAELTVPDSPEAAAGLPPPARLADSGFGAQQKATVGPDPQKGLMRRVIDATPIPGPQMRAHDSPLHPAKDPSKDGMKPSLDFPLAPFKDDGPRGLRGDPTVIPTGDLVKPTRDDPSHVSTSPFAKPDGPIAGSGAVRTDDTVGALVASLQANPIKPKAPAVRALHVLPRRRGILGDVVYVFTALFGVPRARREAAAVDAEIKKLSAERRARLIALGRAAIVQERFEHPHMGAAREHLEKLEEERSQFAGQVAAADAELEHVQRERAARTRQVQGDLAGLDAELAQLRAKLAPLAREAQAARRKVTAVQDQLRRLDAKIKATEAKLVSVKTAREDRAVVQAEIASVKAERLAVQNEEPVLAAQLDAIAPRMAELDGKRTEAETRIAELKDTEADDAARTTELVAAIEAKRKVVARSLADAEKARDKSLHGLAERLLLERPKELGRAFEPIDELDVTIGEEERRAMELKELLANVERGAVVRGVAVMVMILGAAVAGVVLALMA